MTTTIEREVRYIRVIAKRGSFSNIQQVRTPEESMALYDKLTAEGWDVECRSMCDTVLVEVSEEQYKNAEHVWERAGLGKAPFRFEGISEERGPIRLADGTQVGAPGQPMGCCAYCYTGIAECCHIRSADGKRFIVGNECVRKTGDKGLIISMKPALNKARKEARHKAEHDGIKWASDELKRPEVIALLAGKPHPLAYMATSGKTAFDWALWMMRHAGASGRMKVVRYLRKLAKPEGGA